MKNSKKERKKVVRIIVIAGIVILVWLLFIYPLIKFNNNEKEIKLAAEKYLSINKSEVAKEGELRTIKVQTLIDKKYITDLRTAYNHGTCDVKESFVKVRKENGKYKYYPYLKCGIFTSNIDHKGPVITLEGDEKVNVEKDSEWKDPGVKSVVDNQDGTIDTSKVVVKGEVDTSKIGKYVITYTVLDSMENETVKERVVTVTQGFSKTVKKVLKTSDYYKGRDVNNYVMFSGQLFRIVGLDSDNNIKIVSDEDISQVDGASLKDWLNNYYYKHLNTESLKYLVSNYEFCTEKITKENVDKITSCKDKTRMNVGLLSISDYNNSIEEGESYLYPETINWTMNSLSDKKGWTTEESFYEHDSKYLDFDKTYHFNVRPVLVLKSSVKLKSGDGSIDNPYNIDDFDEVKAGSSVNKTRSGEYVSYKNTLYRVVEPDENGYTKVISDDLVKIDIYDYETPSIYNPNEKGTFAYYLENETSKYISSKIFVKHSVTVPIYKNKASFSGKPAETKKYKIKFAAPSLYDMYSSGGYNPTYYIESSKNNNLTYFSSYSGVVYYVQDATYPVFETRFTGYLRKDAVIVSGDGTKTSPYNLSY